VTRHLKQVMLAFVIGFMCLAPCSHADNQSAFSRLLANQTLRQQILQTARRSQVMIENPCPSAEYTLDDKIFLHAEPAFDSAGHIVAGDWRQVVDEQGCGQSRVLNVQVLVRGPSSVATIPLLPGTTLASPGLQKDAVKYAVQIVSLIPGGNDPNCKTGHIENTEFVSRESTPVPGGKGLPWRELWTLVSCVQKMQVPMLFIPDATGTSISAGPNKAVKVIPLALAGN
jgi:hypothetical protein